MGEDLYYGKMIKMILVYLTTLFLFAGIASAFNLSVKSDNSWEIKKIDGFENTYFDVELIDKEQKNAIVCITRKPDVFPSKVPDLYLYDKNNIKIKDDKGQDAKVKYSLSACNFKQGYVIDLSETKFQNVGNYLKIGEKTIIIEYQAENRIEFTDKGLNISATLFKEIDGVFDNTVDDIWVHYNDKFGANDTSNTNFSTYRYSFFSESELIKYDNYYYYRDSPRNLYRVNLDDICDVQYPLYEKYYEWENYTTNITITADCHMQTYTEGNLNYLNVTFLSDKFIDPSYEIKNFSTDIVDNVTCRDIVYGGNAGDYCTLTLSTDISPYDKLITYIPFDNPNKLSDYTDYGLVGTSPSTYYNKSGIITGAFKGSDSGSSDFGQASHLDAFDEDWNLSICFWFNYVSGSQAYGRYWVKETGDNVYGIARNNGGNTLFFWDNAGTQRGFSIKNNDFDTHWDHYCIIVDGPGGVTIPDGNIVLYTNGAYTDTLSGMNTNYGKSGQTGLFIGGRGGGGTPTNSYIDEFMIFNMSLNATHISDIYNNQSHRYVHDPKTLGNHSFNVSIQLGFNRINLTINNSNNPSTNLSARIDYDGGNTQAINVTDNNPTQFNISHSTDILNVSIDYFPDANYFFTPMVLRNIILEAWNESDATVPSTCNNTNTTGLIDCTDYCIIDYYVNRHGDNLTFYNEGYIDIAANVTNVSYINIRELCTVNILASYTVESSRGQIVV